MSCFQPLFSSSSSSSSSAALIFPAAVSEFKNTNWFSSSSSSPASGVVLGTRPSSVAPLHAIAIETQPRRSADYTPNIWGNHFLATSPTDPLGIESEVEEHEKMKQEVRGMIVDAMEDPTRNLDLIDAIERLGVSYHFEEEVEKFLQKTHASLNGFIKDNAHNLHQISLCFRLLRQHGFQVSCSNMFSNFIEDDGSFKESVKQDNFEGLMSLFEAAHLRVHGEEILDNALAFSTTQLKLIALNPNYSQFSSIINHSLRNPIRKNFPRLDTRFYISVYQEIKPSHNQLLLHFSKLDFNLVQKQYREELNEISRWWHELDAERRFPFARNRIVEAFFFIMGTYFEPQHKWGRKVATKALAMLTILDDIYDVHGTPQELNLLTQALDRWDPNLGSELPEYLKNFYVALLDTFKELEDDMGAQGDDVDKIKYCKEGLIKVAKAYHTEARWYEENYTPSMEEYMEVALVSVATPFIGAMVLLGMGDHFASKHVFEWFLTHPKIVASACLIPRLQDDIVGHEFEKKRGHSASCVDCYVKEHGRVKEEAVEAFYKQVSDAWKDANADFIRPTSVPMHVLTTLLNISRIAHVVYNDCDGYADPHAIKALVASVFVHPIPY